MQPQMPHPVLLVTARPNKKAKKRKSWAEKAETKRALDKARGQTRVNIGASFDRWRKLKHLKGLKTDADVALFLLNRHQKAPSTSTLSKQSLMRPPPQPVSTSVSESQSDRR